MCRHASSFSSTNVTSVGCTGRRVKSARLTACYTRPRAATLDLCSSIVSKLDIFRKCSCPDGLGGARDNEVAVINKCSVFYSWDEFVKL